MAGEDGQPTTILMVDDNLGDCVIVEEALRDCALPVSFHSLQDAGEALAFLSRRPPHAEAPVPDLIILDLGLPGVDGRTLLAIIQADRRLRRIPVVILSSSERDADRQGCVGAGARRYLTKPKTWSEYPAVVRVLEQLWKSGSQPASER